MHCPICHHRAHVVYCAHCINTSPSLLLKLKLDLILLKDENKELNGKVEQILNEAMNYDQLYIKRMEKKKDPLMNSLMKLDVLRMKKNNNLIRHRIEQLNERIYSKRNHISELKVEIDNYKRYKVGTGTDKLREQVEISDAKNKLAQVSKICESARDYKLNLLNNWFVIQKLQDNFQIPFAIAFQPLISLKNFRVLPLAITNDSINIMWKYISFFSDILMIKLSYTNKICEQPMFEFSDSIQTVVQRLIKLIINILQICRHLKLVPSTPMDIPWLLDQYDVDGLFYNMVKRNKMKCRSVSLYWTFGMLYSMVLDNMNNPQRGHPARRTAPPPTVTGSHDRWYVVG
ncbi:ATV_HP_G0011630.mRNA.1.CDS.1 [Saccharomyces cerevisiae]|nr:ATV_HP_G0073070.mRNA.1.CDS.1 [Saccharomyces cerevisiae]CAI5027309.1 ATV_HP_G0011630.mRNA.1.CDS.1 [Saccharomyces cerevisiae]CAI6382795.1 ATV_HP_G0073070.mRNA.1.CDS.1 [Saccharomyces cerevisiae]CAI6945150.1 ATV_HP_G0011630.mRNA.1.CDS.1 [Saccharomyces cerevisiae]